MANHFAAVLCEFFERFCEAVFADLARLGDVVRFDELFEKFAVRKRDAVLKLFVAEADIERHKCNAACLGFLGFEVAGGICQ